MFHMFKQSAQTSTERRLHSRLRTDCIFDVGADEGQSASNLRSVTRFYGTIISFEPNPVAFEKLEAAAAFDPQWHCFPYALGSERQGATRRLSDMYYHLQASLGFERPFLKMGTHDLEVVKGAERVLGEFGGAQTEAPDAFAEMGWLLVEQAETNCYFVNGASAA